MDSIWKTARVFISSTFRDMHAERDHLVKVVFPELRERLLPHRIYLDDIDLRWGITEEESKKDKVLDLCLQQIDECRPFFIGILGERYGWVPTTPLSREAVKRFEKYGKTQLETDQSVTELEILFGVLLMDPRMKGRSFFYFRNPRFLNTVPTDRRREVRHQFQEFPTEEEIQQLELKQARREAAIRRLKLRRLKQKIRAVHERGYPVYEDYPGRWDPGAFDRPTKTHGRLVGLGDFGRQVRDQLWEAITAEFELPEQPPSPGAADEAARLAAESDDQARFIESRLRVYVGREDLQRELVAYALFDIPKPCLVTGPSGSGKSAALAQFVKKAPKDLPGMVVISHFIGASPRSTALRDVLNRLCSELHEKLLKTEKQIRLAEITGTGEQVEERRQIIEQEFAIPEEINPLVNTWRKFLTMVPEQQHVVIVLDALNQLEEGDRAWELWWLPLDLSTHVRAIVSTIVDPASPEAEQDPVAKKFRHRPFHPVRVGALTVRNALTIVRRVPSISAKTLDRKQRRRLLENPATKNPLYLRVALEELRGFGSFEELNDRIAALPRPGLADAIYERAKFSPEAMRQAGDPLTALFTQVIQRLESEFSASLVHDSLTILAAARRGLSEREFQEFLADHNDVDDLFPVLRQLRSNLMNRTGLLGFYHAGLVQAVRRYYLDNEEKKRDAHRRVAESFAKQGFFLESLDAQRERQRRTPPTSRPANVRKVDELPWQWLHANAWDHLTGLLRDLFFLEAKAEAGLVLDLVLDFIQAIERTPHNNSNGRILKLVCEILRTDLQFLARHPTTVFQCLWNRGWWFDCPQAAAHYDPPTGGWPAEGPPWSRPENERLATCLELWHRVKQHHSPGFPWIRALRPPELPLGSGQLAQFLGHERKVISVGFSPDGRRIASGDNDTVRLWDTDSGGQLSRIQLSDKGRVQELEFTLDGSRVSGDSGSIRHHAGSGGDSVAFSPDGRRIASARHNLVLVWDTDSGAELARLRGHKDGVTSVAFSPDGRQIASGALDGIVLFWGADSGAEMARLELSDERLAREVRSLSNVFGPFRWKASVAFSPDGRRIVTAWYTSVQLWNAGSGTEEARLQERDRLEALCGLSADGRSLTVYAEGITCVAYSPDGRRIASGSDNGMIRVWHAGSRAELIRFPGPEKRVSTIAFSPDGRYIASGFPDATVRVWDAESGAELARFHGHRDEVTSVAYAPDGRRIASGSYDRTVRVWDAESGAKPARLHGPEGYSLAWSFSLAFSPDGRRIASSGDKTVRVWDIASGSEVTKFHGHERSAHVIAYSPDSRRILSVSSDARVWDAESGAELALVKGNTLGVRSVAFSPDGRCIASGWCDGTVRVWNADNGTELARLHGHEREVVCVAYSPDGRRIASGSYDCTVRLWDPRRSWIVAALLGREVARFKWDYQISRIAYSPDGRRIASKSGHRGDVVLLCEAATGRLIEFIPRCWDVTAIAAGPVTFPWCAMNHGLETVIEPSRGGDAIAWFPVALEAIATHPFGRIWAGIVKHRLYLLQLEGEPGYGLGHEAHACT